MENDLDKISRSDLKKEVSLSKGGKSYEYSSFVKERVERKSFYEILCQRVGKYVKIPMSSKENENLQKEIKFTNTSVDFTVRFMQ